MVGVPLETVSGPIGALPSSEPKARILASNFDLPVNFLDCNWLVEVGRKTGGRVTAARLDARALSVILIPRAARRPTWIQERLGSDS